MEKRGSGFVLRADPAVRVASRAHKMSKSRGNVVNPDDVVAMYGADSLRLYEMFMGPIRDTKVAPIHLIQATEWLWVALYVPFVAACHLSLQAPAVIPAGMRSTSNVRCHGGQVWSTKSVEGVHRFLARAYRLVTGDNLTNAEPSRDQLRLLHTTIKRASQLRPFMHGAETLS